MSKVKIAAVVAAVFVGIGVVSAVASTSDVAQSEPTATPYVAVVTETLTVVEPTPTAEPTPAPTAAPAVAGIGDTVTVGDRETVTVEKVTAFKGEGYVTVNPAKGNTVIAVLVEVTALQDDADYNFFYATVRDAEGFEYTSQVFPAKSPELTSGTLNAGQTAKGWVTFEVPKDGALTFLWSPIFAGTAEVTIR